MASEEKVLIFFSLQFLQDFLELNYHSGLITNRERSWLYVKNESNSSNAKTGKAHYEHLTTKVSKRLDFICFHLYLPFSIM